VLRGANPLIELRNVEPQINLPMELIQIPELTAEETDFKQYAEMAL
jgi:hypothetical protein